MSSSIRSLLLASAAASGLLLVAACGSNPQPSPTASAPLVTPGGSPLASPTSTATPASIPAGTPVPAGFVPQSVTFVSVQAGWVLGTAPCAAGSCLTLLRTVDGGHSWVAVPAPATAFSADVGSGHGAREVRFATPQDGWLFGPELWATHDGGATWSRVSLPGASGTAAVVDLEAASGMVHAAVFDGQVAIDSSASDHEAWSRSPTSIPFGAGPVPKARLALHADGGWLIEVDRTVVGGARLGGGQWSQWTPPCRNAGGDAQVDASTTTALFAVCNEGVWTGGPPITHAYVSTDGGGSFTQSRAAVPVGNADELASPSAQVAVVAGHSNGGGIDELLLTTDGGASWKVVFKGAGTGVANDLGFTTALQGVVVVVDQGSASLLMTTDGGASWAPVRFG
jgi:photosystem II stability/assembly factor-like uncharacterized protein